MRKDSSKRRIALLPELIYKIAARLDAEEFRYIFLRALQYGDPQSPLFGVPPEDWGEEMGGKLVTQEEARTYWAMFELLRGPIEWDDKRYSEKEDRSRYHGLIGNAIKYEIFPGATAEELKKRLPFESWISAGAPNFREWIDLGMPGLQQHPKAGRDGGDTGRDGGDTGRDGGDTGRDGFTPRAIPLSTPDPFIKSHFSNASASADIKELTKKWAKYCAKSGKPIGDVAKEELDKTIQKMVAIYGEEAVTELISRCISSGWKNIRWEILTSAPGGRQSAARPPQDNGQATAEELRQAAQALRDQAKPPTPPTE